MLKQVLMAYFFKFVVAVVKFYHSLEKELM